MRSRTSIVKSLDPAIERAILRCLQIDPAKRPASATAVAASLPGGDPLAAAVAAGETPSPEMVAAAGTDERTLSPIAGVSWTLTCLASLVLIAALADRTALIPRVPVTRATSTLLDRAQDLAHQLSVTSAVGDRAWGYAADSDFLAWLQRKQTPVVQSAVLSSGRPPALVFWYRTSPQPFLPQGTAVTISDPIAGAAGMTTVVLDTRGDLVAFESMPPRIDPNALVEGPHGVGGDMAHLMAAANLDVSRFTETTNPSLRERAFADTRRAMIGSTPELPGTPLEVDAGWFLGAPVYFAIVGPWNRPDAAASVNRSEPSIIALVATVIVIPGMLLGAALVARGNVRRGRGDRRGAARLAGAVLIVSMARWLFLAHHTTAADLETTRFFAALGGALVDAGMVWLFYLAAEPQVRRIWPHILITWSRLLAGSFRDPMVGRDLAIGAACGAAMSVISYAFYLLPSWLPWISIAPRVQSPDALLGTRYALGLLFDTLSSALQNAMLGVLGLALLRLVLLRLRLARTGIIFAIATAIFSFLAARGQFQSGQWLVDITFGVILVVIILGVIFRLGLFAGIAAFFAHFWTYKLLLTLDPDRQYFTSGSIGLGVVAAMAMAGFVLARGHQPLFGKVITD